MQTSLSSSGPRPLGWIGRLLPIAMLCAIAGLSMWTYTTVSAIVRVQDATTHTVGLVTRQAMLTERIAELCVELESHAYLKKQTADSNQLPDQAQDDAQDLSAEKAEEKTRDDLRQSTALMLMAHQGLINGSQDLKVEKPSAAVNKVYFGEPYQLDHQVVYFVAAANSVADMAAGELSPESEPLIAVQLAARENLLAGEEAAASAYEGESARTVAKLKQQVGRMHVVTILLVLGAMVMGVLGWRRDGERE